MNRFRRAVESIREFVLTAPQTVVAEFGQTVGIAFSVGYRLQDASPAYPQEISRYRSPMRR